MDCCNDNIIVQYTTPTITITFPTVDVTTVSEAYLTFKSAGTVLLTKDLLAAVVDSVSKTISWRLSQADTKLFPLNSVVRVYCDWKLTDATRGRSKFAEYLIVETGQEEVI